MKYFAYGSNMLTTRLRARTDSAAHPRAYVLKSHQLRFHKRSVDGSGKCNVICTDEPTDIVHGVLFDVAGDQIPDLDRHEGVGHGYSHKRCRLTVDGIQHDVFMYVADADYIDDSLVPYKWYLDLVVAGAEENRLPRDYIAALRALPFAPDPKPDRKTRLVALEALGKDR